MSGPSMGEPAAIHSESDEVEPKRPVEKFDTQRGDRWVRGAKFTLPTIGSVLARVAQLLVLVVLSVSSHGAERAVLVSGFGLLASFAILTDAGGANYILSSDVRRIDARTFRRVVSLQFGLGLVGGAAALTFLNASARGRYTAEIAVILVAIALAQTVESTFRTIRAPLLVRRRDDIYAYGDFALFILKAVLVLLVMSSGNITLLLFLPVCSLAVSVPTFFFVMKRLPSPGRKVRRLIISVLEYGVTSGLSAFYSQSPMIIGSLFLSSQQLATLALIYRVVQPTEMVPSMMSQQLLPRIRTRRRSPWRYWAMFAMGGVLVLVLVVAFRPLIELVFGQSFSPVSVFYLVAVSIVPKFGNYALVAYLMATGHIRARLFMTLSVGLLAVAGAWVAAVVGGEVALASVTPLSECAMIGLFVLVEFALLRGRPQR